METGSLGSFRQQALALLSTIGTDSVTDPATETVTEPVQHGHCATADHVAAPTPRPATACKDSITAASASVASTDETVSTPHSDLRTSAATLETNETTSTPRPKTPSPSLPTTKVKKARKRLPTLLAPAQLPVDLIPTFDLAVTELQSKSSCPRWLSRVRKVVISKYKSALVNPANSHIRHTLRRHPAGPRVVMQQYVRQGRVSLAVNGGTMSTAELDNLVEHVAYTYMRHIDKSSGTLSLLILPLDIYSIVVTIQDKYSIVAREGVFFLIKDKEQYVYHVRVEPDKRAVIPTRHYRLCLRPTPSTSDPVPSESSPEAPAPSTNPPVPGPGLPSESSPEAPAPSTNPPAPSTNPPAPSPNPPAPSPNPPATSPESPATSPESPVSLYGPVTTFSPDTTPFGTEDQQDCVTDIVALAAEGAQSETVLSVGTTTATAQRLDPDDRPRKKIKT